MNLTQQSNASQHNGNNRKSGAIRSILERWLFDVGCWTFDDDGWMLDLRCSTLDLGDAPTFPLKPSEARASYVRRSQLRCIRGGQPYSASEREPEQIEKRSA